MIDLDEVVRQTAETLVRAGSTFTDDKKRAYERAIQQEGDSLAGWVLKKTLENAAIAEKNVSPLCDDTGIPHVYLEVGEQTALPAGLLPAIEEGVRQGLRLFPGRPMAVRGNDVERISQCEGISDDPADLEMAPPLVRCVPGKGIRLHVLMLGGGPAIRGKTLRIFHRHSVDAVADELISWATEAVAQLGCTPCTLAIGLGRSAYEASSMMMEAQIEGNYDEQTPLEQRITDAVNQSGVGPLGLGGNHSVLATFLKVGPQRSSGVRIACLRPCCCFEPRHAWVNLLE